MVASLQSRLAVAAVVGVLGMRSTTVFVGNHHPANTRIIFANQPRHTSELILKGAYEEAGEAFVNKLAKKGKTVELTEVEKKKKKGIVQMIGGVGKLSADRPYDVSIDDEGNYGFQYGWSNDLGRWLEMPQNHIKKWWQKPSYFTPFGYPEPPHWHLSTYKLSCAELELAKTESIMMQQLKARGMTREEVDARAMMFEFFEDEDRPKMTDKMRFYLQLNAMIDNRDHDYMVDVREDKTTPLPMMPHRALPKLAPRSA